MGIQMWRGGRWLTDSGGRRRTVSAGAREAAKPSPARAELTNDISVCNTIVLPRQANAIRASPELSAHSGGEAPGQTLEELQASSLKWTKHTISLSPMCPDQRGLNPIVASL